MDAIIEKNRSNNKQLVKDSYVVSICWPLTEKSLCPEVLAYPRKAKEHRFLQRSHQTPELEAAISDIPQENKMLLVNILK